MLECGAGGPIAGVLGGREAEAPSSSTCIISSSPSFASLWLTSALDGTWSWDASSSSSKGVTSRPSMLARRNLAGEATAKPGEVIPGPRRNSVDGPGDVGRARDGPDQVSLDICSVGDCGTGTLTCSLADGDRRLPRPSPGSPEQKGARRGEYLDGERDADEGLITVLEARDGLEGIEIGPDGRRASIFTADLLLKGRAKSVEEVEKAFAEGSVGDTEADEEAEEELPKPEADGGCK